MARTNQAPLLFTDGKIAGGVSLCSNPGYRPVVHLCRDLRLVASALSQDAFIATPENHYVRTFEFELEPLGLRDVAADRLSLYVAETGERLGPDITGTGLVTVEELLTRSAAEPDHAPATFIDAAERNLAAQDIIDFMFRDYLGRRCDPIAIDAWSTGLRDRKTIYDLITDLIASPEYAERPKTVSMLPGQIFSKALLYAVDAARHAELTRQRFERSFTIAPVDVGYLWDLDDEAFLKETWRLILGSPIDERGMQAFLGEMQRRNGERTWVIAEVLATPGAKHFTYLSGFKAGDLA